ncbi:hypothetical protein [Pseudonocardia oroxyli]|uniref:Uncharacterized protein n=1 Tax=Pseudonocardia oroxyli TaxID=366584 RepID=A0A1G7UKC2_PSEOR|nr:hypothetical protein [Pseudonocardia oroxyli]SDG47937.1 hypothetical protein SAMN05216377_11273 [Pseudonocardia oroxyli]
MNLIHDVSGLIEVYQNGPLVTIVRDSGLSRRSTEIREVKARFLTGQSEQLSQELVTAAAQMRSGFAYTTNYLIVNNDNTKA